METVTSESRVRGWVRWGASGCPYIFMSNHHTRYVAELGVELASTGLADNRFDPLIYWVKVWFGYLGDHAVAIYAYFNLFDSFCNISVLM